MKLCLETSSYLPLVWRTPYTPGVIQQIQELPWDELLIQQDSIREALGYLSYDRDWKREAWTKPPIPIIVATSANPVIFS